MQLMTDNNKMVSFIIKLKIILYTKLDLISYIIDIATTSRGSHFNTYNVLGTSMVKTLSMKKQGKSKDKAS